MSLTWIEHIRQLGQYIITQLVRMVRTLRGVFSTACDENFTIIRLYGTEADRNIEVNV